MAAPRTHRQKEIRRHIWIYGAITPYIVLAIFPIYWMAITAFKQDSDLYRMDQFPLWFHLAPTWKHFSYLFYSTNYGAWIVNTMDIAAWVAVITLLIAVPAGYAMQYVDCGNGGRQTVYDVRWDLITMSSYARMAIISARPTGATVNGGLRFVMPANLRTIGGL